MEATWTQVVQAVMSVLTLLLAFVVLPMFRLLWRVKMNDLHHIDVKVDDIKAAVDKGLSDLRGDVHRVGDKIDRHIEWHAGQAA